MKMLYLPIILIFTGITSIYAQDWEWQSLPNMPTARVGHCAVVYHDKVWNIGGKTRLNASLATIDCYDLLACRWESNVPHLLHRRFNAAAVVHEDKVFVIGGRDGARILNAVEFYDPTTNQWQEFTPLRFPREGMNAVVFEGKLYVIGGLALHGFHSGLLDTVEFWDESAQGWQKSTSWTLQKPRVFMQSVVSDSYVYTLGGMWIDVLLTVNERFGTLSGSELLNSLPSPRSYFSAVAIQNQIYAIGGFELGDTVLNDTIDVYNVTLNQWDTSGIKMGIPRAGLTAVSYNNDIYMFGGIDSNVRITQTAERLYQSPTPVIVKNNPCLPPNEHGILKNFPNPFNAATAIIFQLERTEHQMQLVIFNLRGEQVRTFKLNQLSPGLHQVQWDGRDENGRIVESGIYLAQLRSDRLQGQVLKLSFVK